MILIFLKLLFLYNFNSLPKIQLEADSWHAPPLLPPHTSVTMSLTSAKVKIPYCAIDRVG